ncbi:endo-1,4-beta-xylanase [Deminuibacter soli]|nr:endo-1,4-beta-xylanase [Deminuibacter soli]
MKQVFIYILFTALACKKDAVQNDLLKPAAGGETLQSIAAIPIGASVNPGDLTGTFGYKKIVAQEMSSITAENVMKWGSLQPKQDDFEFADADKIAAFAQSYQKRLHGHNLCWYTGNPDWVNKFQGDAAAWDSLLKTHITTVVSHFKGQAASWDVVNEAFQDNNSGDYRNLQTEANNDDGCIWYRHIGKDYVAHAFQYAHAADPAAILFYNDYNQEKFTNKLKAILDMVADFKARNIPIGGLGLQMHIDISTSNDSIAAALKACAATGLKIHISELDICVNLTWDKTATYTADLQKKQADKYAFVVQQYLQLVPKEQQYGITMWNVGDGDSWWNQAPLLRHDWPLLFDSAYKRKPAYDAFAAALKNGNK